MDAFIVQQLGFKILNIRINYKIYIKFSMFFSFYIESKFTEMNAGMDR